MCLIGIRWEPDSETPFLMVANRDEFYARPTEKGHFWDDNQDVFGGKDLLAGGSWLGVSRKGRFAAVTNYREVPLIAGKRSRGELVSNFLCGDSDAREYLEAINRHADDFSGFNLLLADHTGLYYYSNRGKQGITRLQPGMYVLTNHLLDTPWPKAKKLRKSLEASVNQSVSVDEWVKVMNDPRQADDQELPSTGVGVERERLLSSMFITSDDYGTRTTTVIELDKENELSWYERHYIQNEITTNVETQIRLSNNML
ncbi:NRDE family protein [Endozoicomonadaceae bacterium StTr2]